MTRASAKKVINLANEIQKSPHLPKGLSQAIKSNEYTPIDKSLYPVFENCFPKIVSDYFLKCREQLRLEEDAYLRNKEAALKTKIVIFSLIKSFFIHISKTKSSRTRPYRQN